MVQFCCEKPSASGDADYGGAGQAAGTIKAQPNPADDYAPFADDALARAFTQAHPELRYVARWGKWLEWGEDGWVEDTTLKVYDMARKVRVGIADATCECGAVAGVARSKSSGHPCVP